MADGVRSVCRACKSRRDRERRRERRGKPADDDPAPASRNPLALLSAADVADADARRGLLAELRANGVEYVERDGREFRLLRLPSFDPESSVVSPSRIEQRNTRAARIA